MLSPRCVGSLLVVFTALAARAEGGGPAAAAPTAVTPDAEPCVTAPPRIAGLGRATLASRCGSKDGLSHKGDAISLQARGHFRLEAELDSGSALEVTCVSSSEPITATLGDGQAPWFHLDNTVACGAWNKNEQVCAKDGVEVLVCGAATQRKKALAARPLGLPTWYVAEQPLEAATSSEAAASPDPATSPNPAPAEQKRPLSKRLVRVVLQEPVATGLDGARLVPIFSQSLTAELRKRAGLTVVSVDELRALIEQEGERQLAGCTEEGCLAEIADALDADVVITAQLAEVGDEHTVAVRRLATKDAHATQTYELRFPRGNGEGFLGAVGPAVEKLFADHPLRAGEIAGVDKEAALLLNPPPLSPWIMQTTIAASVASLGVAGAVGLFTALEVSSLDDRLRQSTTTVVDGGGLVRDHQRAVLASGVAWGALGVAASLGIAAGVLVPFTNFTADERDD